MIFTDYRQHIPKITASPVCTAIKKTTPIASNYAFHFHRALNSRLCIFKCSSFWGTESPDPLPGLRPWTHWGTSFLQTPRFGSPTSPSRSAPVPYPIPLVECSLLYNLIECQTKCQQIKQDHLRPYGRYDTRVCLWMSIVSYKS